MKVRTFSHHWPVLKAKALSAPVLAETPGRRRALAIAGAAVLGAGFAPARAHAQTLEDADADVFHGRASFYGQEFAGRSTANGERYDPFGLTMAHRDLPFGAWVRVTNLHNQHSVVVRVNDRGPFVRGRVADLSHGAAKRLRMTQAGVVLARFELLKSAPQV